jgi:hypothetical protein
MVTSAKIDNSFYWKPLLSGKNQKILRFTNNDNKNMVPYKHEIPHHSIL